MDNMKAPAFSFYVRDWLGSGKVELASGKVIKAYMYLLCRAWLEEPRATLPMDDKVLAVYARVSPQEWEQIKPEVLSFFELGKCCKHKGRYYSERLLEVSNISDIRTLARKNKTKTKARTEVLHPAEDEIANEIEDAIEIFKRKVLEFKKEYSEKMLTAFFEYWTEPNPSRTKVRFQMEKTWDLKRRLKRWANNDTTFKGRGRQEEEIETVTEEEARAKGYL